MDKSPLEMLSVIGWSWLPGRSKLPEYAARSTESAAVANRAIAPTLPLIPSPHAYRASPIASNEISGAP